MVKISGAVQHTGRLKEGVSQAGLDIIGSYLFAAAQKVAVDAQTSLTEGAVSGANHQPSAPGTPPNNDTGVLANNIEAVQETQLKAVVYSSAPYAAIHEFGGTINHPGGTPYFIGKDGLARFVGKGGYAATHTLPVTKPHTITMPARPYMAPALEKNRELIVKYILTGINRANKTSG